MVTSSCVIGCAEIKEDAAGVAYARIREMRTAYRIWLETVNKRVRLEDLDVGERTILKWILRNWCLSMWTDLSSFGWSPVAGLSWTR